MLAPGCYKKHLYVQQENIDVSYLASTKVQTPDPRQNHPPQGQKLIVAWDFPKSLFSLDLTLVTTVRFWDHTQKEIRTPLERKRDCLSFYFPNGGDGEKKILTYRVQIFSAKGDVIETWEHHFWTELIDFNIKRSFSSPSRMSDSVSSQPKQESVMETPYFKEERSSPKDCLPE